MPAIGGKGERAGGVVRVPDEPLLDRAEAGVRRVVCPENDRTVWGGRGDEVAVSGYCKGVDGEVVAQRGGASCVRTSVGECEAGGGERDVETDGSVPAMVGVLSRSCSYACS